MAGGAIALLVTSTTAGCVGCPAGLLVGVLTEESGELLVNPAFGGSWRVNWPPGFGVHREGETLVVTDFLGRFRGREGDVIRIGGGVGTEGQPGTWNACGTVEQGDADDLVVP